MGIISWRPWCRWGAGHGRSPADPIARLPFARLLGHIELVSTILDSPKRAQTVRWPTFGLAIISTARFCVRLRAPYKDTVVEVLLGAYFAPQKLRRKARASFGRPGFGLVEGFALAGLGIHIQPDASNHIIPRDPFRGPVRTSDACRGSALAIFLIKPLDFGLPFLRFVTALRRARNTPCVPKDILQKQQGKTSYKKPICFVHKSRLCSLKRIACALAPCSGQHSVAPTLFPA